MSFYNSSCFQHFIKNLKDTQTLPNISDVPGEILYATEKLGCGRPVVLYTEEGVPFSARLYLNAARVDLSPGPAVIAMYPGVDGLEYQSLPISNTSDDYLKTILQLIQNPTPDPIQSAETAQMLRQNINDRAAMDISRELTSDHSCSCRLQIITATGATVETGFVRRDGQYCLYCHLDDDQIMELHISSEETQDIHKIIDTFCDSFDEYWKQTDIEAIEQDGLNQDNLDIDEIE